MRMIPILLLLSLYQVQANAQAVWSLDDCIRYGTARNLPLQNSRLDVRIAREEHLGAIGHFLPEVSTSGSLGKRIGRSVDPQTNGYTSSSFVEGGMALTVSWPLFEGFTRINRLRFARINQQIGGLEAKVKENDLAYNILDAFYTLCFDEKLLELAVEQRRLSERYLVRMEEQLALGMKSAADRQELKARLQSDLYQETMRRNGCHASLLHLKELLSLTADDSLRVRYEADEGSLPPEEQPTAAELYRQATAVMPQLLAGQLQQQASRKSQALAAGSFAPSIHADFSFGSSFLNTAVDAEGTQIPLSRQLSNNQGKYLGLRVAFPILSRLTRFTEVRKARLRVRQADQRAAQQQLTLRAETEQALQQLQAASAEHRQAAEQLRAEALSLRENEEKWTEGLLSVFELMEKRNRYIAAKAELSRTRLQYELKSRTIRFYQTGTFTPTN